ncbi:acyltransferase [Serratia sp. T13T92]|uniref:acyltransferase n=1 Tax=Serratia sp. T13T92 TaxID=3397496 RepID=UPI0039E1DF54
MGWLSLNDLKKVGFKSFGNNVLISDKASFHNTSNITIGSNVRIDDFCVISAGSDGVIIGDFVHIAVYSSIIGKGAITIKDYCNISSRVSIYSSSDDYSGEFMTNPMIPADLTNVHHQEVTLEKHCIVGSGSVILPGAKLDVGVAIGALSLIKGTCNQFTIYAGVPAKIIGLRKMNILELEKKINDRS